MKYENLTREIIGCFYQVYNHLGYGFLEKVYERAMIIELQYKGLHVDAQKPIIVHYRGEAVGNYYADLVVEDRVIVELKAVHHLLPEHKAQILNYLNATEYEVGLLMNFGPKASVVRKVFDNPLKPYKPASYP
jgi:GxxExxY protein